MAPAQDERSVTSPDRQIEFRLGFGQPAPGALFQLAYQVFFHGKPLLNTSFLGLEIYNQEPTLGANLGLTGSKVTSGSHFNSLIAEYMQNGSLGRRLNLEVRAFDEGVAFRYVIPRSQPLDEILIDDEATEFSFAKELGKQISPTLPFTAEQPGIGWVVVTEVAAKGYPHMALLRSEPKTMVTRLDRLASNPALAVHTNTPLTSSWRVILIGDSRAHVAESRVPDILNP